MTSTIFHAFNMRYSKIAELAPTLKDLGISHVQFPPVQAARELSEYDGELLRQQIKLRDAHLARFHALCVDAKRKAVAHPGHTFDHILKHRVYYVNQPLLRAMYGYLLEGVSFEDLTKHIYDRLPTIDSPVVRAFLDIGAVGEKHPWYDLVHAADLVLAGTNPCGGRDIPDIELQLAELTLQFKDIQELVGSYKKAKRELPPDIASLNSTIRKRRTALFERKHRAEASRALEILMEKTKEIRQEIICAAGAGACAVTTGAGDAHTLINRICLYELMMFPPWWLIYQPLRLEIGDTFLGREDEIRAAFTACKTHGLRVIVDIVVNNLAATAGERAEWMPIARRAPIDAQTLADIPDIVDNPTVVRLRDLLRGAFGGTDDLGLVTVPHSCEQGREPTRCWMSQALPQLNQSHPAVMLAQETFMASLASAGVDGVRIDAAAHLAPADCKRIIDTFNAFRGGPDISYIEYLGGSEPWRTYPFSAYDQVARLEDFEIGESLYKSVFGPQADLERTKNYGGVRLQRYPTLDSVVMLVNHDHVMGSIPSALYTDLPSQISYELSLAYLIQRVYGHVLLMPHDLSSELVLRAVLLRAAMRDTRILREYVDVDRSTMTSYKFDADGRARFVALFNLGTVGAAFKWMELDRHFDESQLCKIYNSQHNIWMRRCYIGSRHGKTLRAPRQKRNITRRHQQSSKPNI